MRNICRKEKITFNNQEIRMLSQAVIEYTEIMSQGEETADYTQYMLHNGLGSAMRKLLKRKNGEHVYSAYPFRGKDYVYPDFNEWVKKYREEHIEDYSEEDDEE